jgi:hypothetical protein
LQRGNYGGRGCCAGCSHSRHRLRREPRLRALKLYAADTIQILTGERERRVREYLHDLTGVDFAGRREWKEYFSKLPLPRCKSGDCPLGWMELYEIYARTPPDPMLWDARFQQEVGRGIMTISFPGFRDRKMFSMRIGRRLGMLFARTFREETRPWIGLKIKLADLSIRPKYGCNGGRAGDQTKVIPSDRVSHIQIRCWPKSLHV